MSPPPCPTPLQAYVNELCSNITSAASELTAAIESGGAGANLAAMATLYKCPGDIRLDTLFYRVVWPVTAVDWQRSLG